MPTDATHYWQGQYYKIGRFGKWFIWVNEWILSDMDREIVDLKKVTEL